MTNPVQNSDYKYLLPDEELLVIAPVEEALPEHLPSDILELERLSQVSAAIDIGKNPVVASLPLSSNENNPDLRLYEAVFGRDSLRVALDLIDRYPEIARTTLISLAENQGVEYNREREEEPGRIPHEIRDPEVDEVAKRLSRELGWGWPYYGAVDATPEFIRTLCKYCRKDKDGQKFLQTTKFVGRDQQTHTMRQAMDAAISWIFRRMDANPEGLIEFKHAFPLGIDNQMWRDSWDSFYHTNGEMANHNQGVAAVDVQRVAYDAMIDAAHIYKIFLADDEKAQELLSRAEHLKRQIMDIFWTDDKNGYFIIGTDRDENGKVRQLKVRSSDMGHLLHSKLLKSGETEAFRREAVVRQLFSGDMIGLNGIRTVAIDETRYRPGAYHNGSVWIWDNYLIVQGLAMHGYNKLASFLANKLLNDASATRRFPEYLRGDNDPEQRINTSKVVVYDHRYRRQNIVEQAPQEIQAWSVAAILGIEDHNDTATKIKSNGSDINLNTSDLEDDLLATLS